MKKRLDSKVQKWKVAYFLNAFPQLSETFIMNEILEIKRQGINVRIYSIGQAKEATVHKEAIPLIKDTVYLEDIGKKKKLLGLLYCLLTRPLRLFKTLLFVIRRQDKTLNWTLKRSFYLAWEVNGSGFQHIHAHFALSAAEHAMLVAKLTGATYSMAPHAVDIYVHQRLLREKMNHARFIVTECEYNRKYLLDYNPWYPRERIHVQRLGFNLEKFKPGDRPNQHNQGAAFRLSSISRLVEKKGLIYLMEALAVLKKEGMSFQSIIAGDGPEHKNLESAAERYRLGTSVQLLGAIDSDRVKEILGHTDVFVLPCVVTDSGDRDATPTALIEAMAMGLPVISTTIAGIPEIIPKDCGILVPPRDPIALAKAIRSVYEIGVEGRIAMGRRGVEFVMTCCNIESEAKKLIGLFEEHI